MSLSPAVASVLITPVVVYTFFLLIHWIPFRLRRVVGRTRTMTLTLLLCLPLTYSVYFWLRTHLPSSPSLQFPLFLVFTWLAFTLLWCGYVQFVFSFDTSPSLRFLIEFLDSRSPSLTAEEIKARFDFDEVYRRRVLRAVEGEAILTEKKGDEVFLYNSPLATRFAVLGRCLKDFMNLGAGG